MSRFQSWAEVCAEKDAQIERLFAEVARRPDDEKYQAVIDRMIDLEQALRLFVDDAPCRFDHHGYCQEHDVSKPCRVAYARSLLEGKPA